MDDSLKTEVQEVGHLGLVASIIHKFKVTERINRLLPKESNNQKINHAEAILGMIYQGLGFGDGRLYFAKDFFSNKPMELLFGRILEPSMFNDDVLASSLDAIYKYGPSKFFANIAFQILIQNNLLSKLTHLDTTTHSFYGRKYNDDKIKINFGHSKGRQDLPQVLQLLISTDEGIPFWTSVHSGNSSDKDLFPESISAVQTYIKNFKQDISFCFVADSALYSKKFLLNPDVSSDWITRIPESIKLARELIEKDSTSAVWIKRDDEYKYCEFKVTYGKVEQRWVVVRCRKSRHKELATFEKKLKKEGADLTIKATALMKRLFLKKSEIFFELRKLKKSHPHFEIEFKILGNFKLVKGQRPKAAKGNRVYISFEKKEDLINAIKNKKGKFIIGSNILEKDKLPTKELVEHYLGRTTNIERCFKVIKDPSLRLNQIFLKRVDRIEALLSVMTLCLFIHNLGQFEMRRSLAKTKETIPNQNGKKVSNPTLKWAFQLMRKVVRVRVDLFFKVFDEFKGIGEIQRKIITCFGSYALSIYGFP